VRGAGRRLSAVVAVPLVVAAGLGVRTVGLGAAASAAGDLLYAVLVYALVVAVAPRWRPAVVAGTAVAVCWLVEAAQLTSIPAALADVWWPVRYVLGTSFVWTDLLLYAVGVLLASGVDLAVSRYRRARSAAEVDGLRRGGRA